MDNIIAKIKKLFALANDAGATEGERDNALRMAYRLIAKHNLDLATVEKMSSRPEEKRIKHTNETWGMLWVCKLSNSIADLFFCHYIRGAKINATRSNHLFIGKASNATTAALLAEYAIQSILKEGRSRGWHNLSAEMRSFGEGAAHKIWQRVKELKAKPEAADIQVSTNTALVLRSLHVTEAVANQAFLNALGIKTKIGRVSNSKVQTAAFRAGQEYGAGIGLNPQVSGTEHAKLR